MLLKLYTMWHDLHKLGVVEPVESLKKPSLMVVETHTIIGTS